MALYSYAKPNKRKSYGKILSLLFICSGLFLLIWVIYPIILFEYVYAPKMTGMIEPVPGEFIKSTFAATLPIFGTGSIDYTKASAWFPHASGIRLNQNSDVQTAHSYTLSIPKVGIDKATVQVGSDDLSKSLVQFTGPLPPQNGNPVIFGHSTLLWFYNPHDYKTIFSKLPELTTEDDIYVTFDSITYRYKIFEMKIVHPDDVAVLEQRYDASYITLVTCVPPGTVFKRLVVRGKLAQLSSL